MPETASTNTSLKLMQMHAMFLASEEIRSSNLILYSLKDFKEGLAENLLDDELPVEDREREPIIISLRQLIAVNTEINGWARRRDFLLHRLLLLSMNQIVEDKI